MLIQSYGGKTLGARLNPPFGIKRVKEMGKNLREIIELLAGEETGERPIQDAVGVCLDYVG